MSPFLQKAFGFDPQKHKVKTEIVAGITTFLTMAYILAVNPDIFKVLEAQGMDNGAVFTATALAAVFGSLLVAFYAKKPFVIAPGMGLNAFFVYTVCLGMGHTWQFALTAVFLEGILFIILTLTNIRKLIIDSIPASIKNAIGAGIGLYIAFIGLKNAGIIVDSQATLVTLGFKVPDAQGVLHASGTAMLALIGLVISCTLTILHVRGGILIGILGTALIGMLPVFNIPEVVDGVATGAIITGPITNFSHGVVSAPPSIAPIFWQFEWSNVASWDMIIVVMTFLFTDMFDAIGTVIGVSTKAGMVDKDGNVEGINDIFMSDALATTVGAAIGTSANAVYVESSAGVGAGGRTGLTAFSAACCFALALLFAPIFTAIPSSATAPALIIVGMLMMQPVTKINWLDYRESIPPFLTLILMPLTFSIADGILIGMISYVILFACSGKFKQITPTMWILAILFILRYIFI